MKKVFLVLILFPILGFSQFASSSYVTLNDGMEDAYLQIEKLWSEYHKEAVKKGHKNSWSIWKVYPAGYEDKIEKSRIPHFMILETFDTKEQMDEEFARYDEKGLAEIRALIKKKLKGKMSSSKIDKILSLNVQKERRGYLHQGIAGTPLTGGSLKPGDKMQVAPMEQLQDDYEKFETEFYQKIFLDNIMKGNHRWWGFTKVIGRSDNALTFNTHAAWNIGIEGKKIEFPEDFASQKIMEITDTARKMYNPTTFELIYRVE